MGLNHPNKKEALKNYVRRNKVVVMAVLETRIREQTLRSISSFGSYWEMDSNAGLASNIRIIFLWNNAEVNVTVERKTLNAYIVTLGAKTHISGVM